MVGGSAHSCATSFLGPVVDLVQLILEDVVVVGMLGQGGLEIGGLRMVESKRVGRVEHRRKLAGCEIAAGQGIAPADQHDDESRDAKADHDGGQDQRLRQRVGEGLGGQHLGQVAFVGQNGGAPRVSRLSQTGPG